MDESLLKHFLLVYNHRTQRLVSQEEFSDSSEAIERYEEEERLNYDKDYMDIVLVASDSIESVKVTHANYFTGNARRAIHSAMNINLVA